MIQVFDLGLMFYERIWRVVIASKVHSKGLIERSQT